MLKNLNLDMFKKMLAPLAKNLFEKGEFVNLRPLKIISKINGETKVRYTIELTRYSLETNEKL